MGPLPLRTQHHYLGPPETTLEQSRDLDGNEVPLRGRRPVPARGPRGIHRHTLAAAVALGPHRGGAGLVWDLVKVRFARPVDPFAQGAG